MSDFAAPAWTRLVSTFLISVASACAAEATETTTFNRDVRPILSENCFACHGFDSKHRKAGLRLDTFAGATMDRDGVRAITPGDPEESELWMRIDSDDPDLVMPPRTSHKPRLTLEQRATIKKWIEQGAAYEPHWAFIPPARRPRLRPTMRRSIRSSRGS